MRSSYAERERGGGGAGSMITEFCRAFSMKIKEKNEMKFSVVIK